MQNSSKNNMNFLQTAAALKSRRSKFAQLKASQQNSRIGDETLFESFRQCLKYKNMAN
jgi:hypothetical protein